MWKADAKVLESCLVRKLTYSSVGDDHMMDAPFESM